MVTFPPPMSNAERQRQFQLRNPGYDARRKAKERAAVKAESARLQLAAQMAAIEAVREPLMLPAPVGPIVVPWTVDEIRQRAEQREAVLVER